MAKKSSKKRHARRIVILFMLLVFIGVSTSILVLRIQRDRDISYTRNAENALPTIEYKPENLYPYLPDGTFKGLEINKFISYDARKYNAKAGGASSASNMIGLQFPAGGNVSLEVIKLEDTNIDTLSFIKNLAGKSSYHSKNIGGKNWYIIQFNYEVTTYNYILKGDKYYVSANLNNPGFTEQQTSDVAKEIEDFLGTIEFK